MLILSWERPVKFSSSRGGPVPNQHSQTKPELYIVFMGFRLCTWLLGRDVLSLYACELACRLCERFIYREPLVVVGI